MTYSWNRTTRYKFYDHIKPDKSNFLIVFLKTLKDRIVIYESGIEFHSFGEVNLHDFEPYVVLAFGSFKCRYLLGLN